MSFFDKNNLLIFFDFFENFPKMSKKIGPPQTWSPGLKKNRELVTGDHLA